MAWVVDTCVVIDVLEGDPAFGLSSARCLDLHRAEGLVVCPVSYAEMGPTFDGVRERQQYFLEQIGIDYLEPWRWLDTCSLHSAWGQYVALKRQGTSPRRPIVDIQIGAFATRFQGLVTRNAGDFRTVFPDLVILDPSPR